MKKIASVRLSKYADHFLKPLVSNIPSFVKDSTDFLRRIFKLNPNLPTDIILLTIDVISLYTNIPHDEGIDASIKYLQRYNSEANTDFLKELLTLILHNFRARSNWLWAVAVSLPLSLSFFFLRHVSCLLTYEFVYIVTYVYIVMYPMSGESNK